MNTKQQDTGFTLIELLIVIVILGVLSTITVFAVRGIADSGEKSSCDTELRNLATAQEANWVLHGTYAAEADLVANQVIKSDSAQYDVTAVDETYTIVPAPDSFCTTSTTGGAGATAVTVAPPGAITLNDLQTSNPASSHTFAGFDSIEYNTGGGNNEIVIFGRTEGEQDFVAMVNAAPATSRRIAFVNLDEFSGNGDILTAMNTSRSNGFTTFALYPDDDPGNAAQAFVASQIGVGANSAQEEFVLLDASGGANQTLLQLLASIG